VCASTTRTYQARWYLQTWWVLRVIFGSDLIRVSISGLPYYCTPLVCVPAVIGALAVWWQNIFVTYRLMTMVSIKKVCTPPRYATIPVLFYVSTVPVFLKIWQWRVSTSLKSGTVDLPIQVDCWCPCVFPKFTILQWRIKLNGSPGAASLPTSRPCCELSRFMSSFLEAGQWTRCQEWKCTLDIWWKVGSHRSGPGAFCWLVQYPLLRN